MTTKTPLGVTQLWEVERDGNPLRRHAHVSPFIGKLAPLDDGALQRIARLGLACLSACKGSTLVIGMTESSLLLSWFVAQELARREANVENTVDLRFTTRHARAGSAHRSFSEPHSHGPQHFLALDEGRVYEQIVVVEDELTTGATLRNLLLAIADATRQVRVLTLADMRAPELRSALQSEMEATGTCLRVIDLSLAPEAPDELFPVQSAPHKAFNPFGRSDVSRALTARVWEDAAIEFETADCYVIGECIDEALARRQCWPLELRPQWRHVTRSPWRTDEHFVHSRHRFECERQCRLSPYFLYNWQGGHASQAVIWSEEFTMGIAAQVQAFLHGQGVASRIVEVSAA